MKHTWFVPVAPLVVAAVVILTSFSLAYAQREGLTVNGTVATGKGTVLRVGLDPKEDPKPINRCNPDTPNGEAGMPLHVVMVDERGGSLDDCKPPKKEYLSATSSTDRRLLMISSKGIIPEVDKITELHADLHIINPSRTASVKLGKPVIRNSSGLIISIGSLDNPPQPPISLSHIQCYVFGRPPWVIPPGGRVYCGLEIILPLIPPALPETFSVRFPVLSQ